MCLYLENHTMSRKCFCYLIKIYFDLAYYTGISPFRLDFQSGKFNKHSWWPHTIFSAIETALLLPWLACDYRSIQFTGKPKNFLQIMHSILTIITKLVPLKIFWVGGGKAFANILNILYFQFESPAKLCTGKGKQWYIAKWVVILCGSLYTFNCVKSVFEGALLGVPLIQKGSSEGWWTSMMIVGRRNLFLEEKFARLDLNSSQIYNKAYFATGVISALGYFPASLLLLYCDLFILISVLILWTATFEFNSLLQADAGWISVYPKYKWLKQLAYLLNKTVGSSVTVFLLEALFYYATSFDKAFVKSGQKSWTNIIELLIFLLNACAILLFSASIPEKMGCFKDWLSASVENGDKGKSVGIIQLVARECDNSCVALKGSNVYPVTYSTLANMLSLSVTYFIICIDEKV